MPNDHLYTQIRTQYSHPIPDPSPDTENPVWPENAYCVGGAVHLFAGGQRHFPGYDEIAQSLMQLNPFLRPDATVPHPVPQTCLLALCNRITLDNDDGEVEDAWATVRLLLTWDGTTGHCPLAGTRPCPHCRAGTPAASPDTDGGSLTSCLTLEDARAYIIEYFTVRRRLMVDGACFTTVCDACDAIDDMWAARLGLTVHELNEHADAVLGWDEARDHALMDWLDGKGPIPSRDYVHPSLSVELCCR